MEETLNTIQQGDCITGMNSLPAGSVDLAFADPPFNIGYDYDVYNDKLGREKYLDWSREWISAVHRILKPDGTFWLAIGDEYAAELKVLSQEIGFHTRSWVIWYYTFGVNCKFKFTRSHAHLFYFVKDSNEFTFRSEDLENRIPSARELVYNDKRANLKGRLPDDTWIIRPANVVGEIIADDGTWSPNDLTPPRDEDQTYTLRPQDLEDCFQADEDTWYFPRVAGTFKERQGFHGCQMPEQLLGRIIRSCSNERDAVLDPFSGSATTLAVAKKLNRRFLGFEISEDYVTYGRNRLEGIRAGDQLDGSAEPTKSAPKTTSSKETSKKRRATELQVGPNVKTERYSKAQLALSLHGVVEAFRVSHNGFSADRVVADPDLNAAFVDNCKKLGIAGAPRAWNILLFRLRKQGKLADIETTRRTSIPWAQCDPYLFACEIALQQLLDQEVTESLDEILCDPEIAVQYDQHAAILAPGYESLAYRWGALRLRKESDKANRRAETLTRQLRKRRKEIESKDLLPLNEFDVRRVNSESGLYLVSNVDMEILYAGESLNLKTRMGKQFSARQKKHWESFAGQLFLRVVNADCRTPGMLAWQSCLAKAYRPKLNLRTLYESAG